MEAVAQSRAGWLLVVDVRAVGDVDQRGCNESDGNGNEVAPDHARDDQECGDGDRCNELNPEVGAHAS